jgi:hypothetical protein
MRGIGEHLMAPARLLTSYAALKAKEVKGIDGEAPRRASDASLELK